MGIIHITTDKNILNANLNNVITNTIAIAVPKDFINISKLLFGVTSFISLPAFFYYFNLRLYFFLFIKVYKNLIK